MSDVIRIQDVTFAYRRTPVLRNVSLSISQGELVGVIGPNGGGKTTLFKLILGFLQPEQGSVEVMVRPNKIAYVPQLLQFDRRFPLSLLELVLMGRLSEARWWGGYGREDKRLAREMLARVGLVDMDKKPFASLSGGQIKRALLARALVGAPDLLLLDEPTAGVDPEASDEIYKLIKELQGNATVLMVTHDLTAAINLVDRVLCVQGTIFSLLPAQVCEHFAMGLYHQPLIKPRRER